MHFFFGEGERGGGGRGIQNRRSNKLPATKRGCSCARSRLPLSTTEVPLVAHTHKKQTRQNLGAHTQHRGPLPKPTAESQTHMPPDVKVFAAHNWGRGGENHRRVAEVVARLKELRVNVWFDEVDMEGNILAAMCDGIDKAAVVLIFVTCEYMAKVDAGGEVDNVRREFMYASRTPEKLLPIRFDANLPRVWSGPLGMVLGAHLYCDMGEGATDENMNELMRMIGTKVRPKAANSGAPQGSARGNAAVKSGGKVSFPATPPAHPDASSLRVVGVNCLTIKERVHRLVHLYGSVDSPSAHTKDIVDRLFVSVVGAGVDKLGMAEKIRLLEEELDPGGVTTH